VKHLLALLLLTACAVPRAAPNQVQNQAAEAIPETGSSAATISADAGDGGNADQSSDWMTFRETTHLWGVVNGTCHRITFSPDKDREKLGEIFGDVNPGIWTNYTHDTDKLELNGIFFSRPRWESKSGIGEWWRAFCRTVLRIGPGHTLGGANLYDSEEACLSALPTAIPLDDSSKKTSERCLSIDDVPVVTDEIACTRSEVFWSNGPLRGCISVLYSDDPFHRKADEKARRKRSNPPKPKK